MSKTTSSIQSFCASGALCFAELLLALAACAGALWVTLPGLFLPNQLFARVGGLYSVGDLGGTLFLVRRAMLGEQGPNSLLLGYPGGAPLLDDFPNTLVTDGIGALAARVGFAEGYNLGLALILVANGLAVFLAARLFGGGRWASVAAGALGTVLPLCVDELLRGRPASALWGPALAGSALCVRSLQGPLPLALVGGALIGLALYIYPFSALLLLPWTLALGLDALRPFGLQALRRGLAGLALATTGAWPGLQHSLAVLPTRLHASTYNPLRDLATQAEALSVGQLLGPEALLMPASLAVIALMCSLLAWRDARRWVPTALLTLALAAVALGPDPWQLGQTSAYAPYTLAMSKLPILRGAPRPSRYALAAALMAAVWLGQVLGLALRSRFAPLGFASAALIGLVRLQPLGPSPSLAWPPLELPPFLAAEPALLDLPYIFPHAQAHLAQVAILPIPRLNTLPSQIPARLRAVEQSPEPLCSALLALTTGREVAEDDLAAIAAGRSRATELGLHYALLHQRAAPAAEIRRWMGFLRQIGARERWRSAELTVYELPGPVVAREPERGP